MNASDAPPYLPPPPPPRPRSGPGREAEVVIVIVVVVAVVVAGTLLLGFLGRGICNCPESPQFLVGVLSDGSQHTGGGYLYKFSVLGTGTPAPTFGDLSFSFSNASADDIVPASDWTLTIAYGSASVVAAFTAGMQGLTDGQNLTVQRGEQLNLFTGPVSLEGGAMTIEGSYDGLHGQQTVSID